MKNKKTIGILLLAVVLIATSLAYFSDHAKVEQSGKTAGLKLSEDINFQGDLDDVLPGKTVDISFTIKPDALKGNIASNVRYKLGLTSWNADGTMNLFAKFGIFDENTQPDVSKDDPMVDSLASGLSWIEYSKTLEEVLNGTDEKVIDGKDEIVINHKLHFSHEDINKLARDAILRLDILIEAVQPGTDNWETVQVGTVKFGGGSTEAVSAIGADSYNEIGDADLFVIDEDGVLSPNLELLYPDGYDGEHNLAPFKKDQIIIPDYIDGIPVRVIANFDPAVYFSTRSLRLPNTLETMLTAQNVSESSPFSEIAYPKSMTGIYNPISFSENHKVKVAWEEGNTLRLGSPIFFQDIDTIIFSSTTSYYGPTLYPSKQGTLIENLILPTKPNETLSFFGFSFYEGDMERTTINKIVYPVGFKGLSEPNSRSTLTIRQVIIEDLGSWETINNILPYSTDGKQQSTVSMYVNSVEPIEMNGETEYGKVLHSRDYTGDRIEMLKLGNGFVGQYHMNPGQSLKLLDLSETHITTLGRSSPIVSSKTQEILLPDTIEVIRSAAFNRAFTEVAPVDFDFSNMSLRQVDEAAFLYANVRNVKMPSTLSVLGEAAFAWSNIQSIDLSNTQITRIEDATFYGSPLAEIKWPANLEYIGEGAFQDTNITRDMVPAGVEVHEHAFGD